MHSTVLCATGCYLPGSESLFLGFELTKPGACVLFVYINVDINVYINRIAACTLVDG